MSKHSSHRQALQSLLNRFLDEEGGPGRDAPDAPAKEELIDEILRVNKRFNYNPSLDEALNSGDGSYKP